MALGGAPLRSGCGHANFTTANPRMDPGPRAAGAPPRHVLATAVLVEFEATASTCPAVVGAGKPL